MKDTDQIFLIIRSSSINRQIMGNKIMCEKDQLLTLIDLQQKLAYVGYDVLPLCHLKLLRDEVDWGIHHILNKGTISDLEEHIPYGF